jgi:parallel beta-helix repeat protein
MKRLLSIGIILLFIGMSLSSSTGFDIEKQSAKPLDGKTLYVGGSGPGNYTKIQDAIDDASDGDTVFVYNGTYYENLTVNNSIMLIGEDRNSTIIDCRWNNYYVINIEVENVEITRFTIINTSYGIMVGASNTIISNNYINTESCGIEIESEDFCIIHQNIVIVDFYYGICTLFGTHNLISGNTIYDATYGIYVGWDYNTVFNNTLMDCVIYIQSNHNKIINNTIYNGSITLLGPTINNCRNNTIYGNRISKTDTGISLVRFCRNNNISFNIISNSGIGIGLFGFCNFNIIYRNTILDCHDNAFFAICSLINKWKSNYWNKPRILPCPILGRLFVFLPWINFDWHPAQEPYDIGG